jgi:UPF0288 family protein (methanogenesis marker protein 3)
MNRLLLNTGMIIIGLLVSKKLVDYLEDKPKNINPVNNKKIGITEDLINDSNKRFASTRKITTTYNIEYQINMPMSTSYMTEYLKNLKNLKKEFSMLNVPVKI